MYAGKGERIMPRWVYEKKYNNPFFLDIGERRQEEERGQKEEKYG
jgi:hypothetical protein